MDTTARKTLIRRWFEEVASQGRYELMDELCATDFKGHNMPPGLPPGREGIRQLMMNNRSIFPDLRDVIEDIIIEGDKVVVRFTGYGTHTGNFMGIEGTGKAVTWPGIGIYRITNNQIAEAWITADIWGTLLQICQDQIQPRPQR